MADGEKEWLGLKLEEIARKRAVLDELKQSLADWEAKVDFGALPEEKKAALLALAEQSVDTLKDMIRKVDESINEKTDEIRDYQQRNDKRD